MGTRLVDMKRRIAHDLRKHGTGFEAGISDAVESAISYYERHQFWFNEEIYTTNTVIGQIKYPLPSDAVDLEHLQVTVNNVQYDLERRAYEYFVERDQQSTIRDQPAVWAVFQNQFWLWPIPGDTYTIALSYIKKLASITDTGSNEWTVEAERLIRYRAEWDLMRTHFAQPNIASVFKASELDELNRLMRETNQKVSSGTVRAWYL